METHKEEGRAFHRVGSMVTDGLVWTKFVLFSTEFKECRGQRQAAAEEGEQM